MKEAVRWVCSRTVRRSALSVEKPLEGGSVPDCVQTRSKDALLDERSWTPQIACSA